MTTASGRRWRVLARYHLYDDAILHFQTALRASPDSDDVKFDLADAYSVKVLHDGPSKPLKVSAAGQQDDAFLALLGDIQAQLGKPPRRKRFSAMPSAAIPTTTSPTFR